MNAWFDFAVLTQLIRDTFRQSRASGIFWIMLAGTGLCVLLCLSVTISEDATLYAKDEPSFFLPRTSTRAVIPEIGNVVGVLAGSTPLDTLTLAAAGQKQGRWNFFAETNPDLRRREGVETISGRMTLAFGAMSIPIPRERRDAVHFLELLLAWGVAGTLGLLLALVWTSGFLPGFLDPGTASVLLAKPVARWQLLLGKCFGVLTFVAFQIVLFVILDWLALGARTNIWDVTYWSCIPLMLLQFAVFYSFSVLLAVMTRSTAACVFGSILFWLLAWGINYGSVMVRGMNEAQSLPALTLALTDAAYWISPKPIDAGLILFNALEAQNHFAKPEVFNFLESGQGFSPWLSNFSSLAITAVLLGLSAHEFQSMDY